MILRTKLSGRDGKFYWDVRGPGVTLFADRVEFNVKTWLVRPNPASKSAWIECEGVPRESNSREVLEVVHVDEPPPTRARAREP